MIRATDVQQDLASVVAVLESVSPLFAEHDQIGVTARPNSEDPLFDAVGWLPEDAAEADYAVITEPFQGTAVESLLKKLPFQYGRTRLMCLRPKSCLSIHVDTALRYHFAIKTNPGCYIVGLSDGEGTFHHIPADGRLYEMDGHRTHTAINAGNHDRVHLVICPADQTRPADAEPVGRISAPL